jgi:hypothetical protein
MEPEKTKLGRPRKNDAPKIYTSVLFPGETEDMVAPGTLRKRLHDEKVRQNKEDQEERSSVPDALDWSQMFHDKLEYRTERDNFILDTTNTISQEVELPHDPRQRDEIEDVIARVCVCALSFKKNTWVWVRRTLQGYMCAGYFLPQFFGEDLVPITYYYNLKTSKTYVQLYNQVLMDLNVRYGQEENESVRTIKKELAGGYVLADWKPWWLEPKPEIKQVKPELKNYRTNEEIKPEPPRPAPEPPPPAPVFRPPSLVDYSTRDLAPEAQSYLAGRDPLAKKDGRFLYGDV